MTESRGEFLLWVDRGYRGQECRGLAGRWLLSSGALQPASLSAIGETRPGHSMQDRPLPRRPANRSSGNCCGGPEEKVQLGSFENTLTVS